MKKLLRVPNSILRLFIIIGILLLTAVQSNAQLSSNISLTSLATPALTPCSGQDTFLLRLTNISASAISNIVVRDSMPAGINYVAGSVSGTNVSFGSTIVLNNVVTFNVSSLPASSSVDIKWVAKAGCSVSSTAADITNTYKVSWGTNFAAPFTTSTYSILFPSISITPNVTGTYNASCFTPFVREIQICNGGFGSVDSITFTDVESNSSLIIQGFDKGTQSGVGTNNAKTILKAADFMTVGNNDGKLDQNECIILRDTLMVVGSTSPVNGVLTANWGCNSMNCSNPSTNTFTLNTTINASSPLQPALTRTATTIDGMDSAGQIYGRMLTHQQIIKNEGGVVALNSNLEIVTQSMRYIDTGTVMASYAGAAPVPASWIRFNHADLVRYHPDGSMGSVLDASYPGQFEPNSIRVSLGDIQPGDSVIITYQTTLAGPVTQTNQFDYYFNNGNQYYCSSTWPNLNHYYKMQDGPATGLPS